MDYPSLAGRARRNRYGGPGTVDLGTFAWPHTPDQKLTKQLMYHTSGTEPVTLKQTVDAQGNNGEAQPAGLISFDPSATVAAGETVDAAATIDPSISLDPSAHRAVSSRVVATGNDGRTW